MNYRVLLIGAVVLVSVGGLFAYTGVQGTHIFEHSDPDNFDDPFRISIADLEANRGPYPSGAVVTFTASITEARAEPGFYEYRMWWNCPVNGEEDSTQSPDPSELSKCSTVPDQWEIQDATSGNQSTTFTHAYTNFDFGQATFRAVLEVRDQDGISEGAHRIDFVDIKVNTALSLDVHDPSGPTSVPKGTTASYSALWNYASNNFNQNQWVIEFYNPAGTLRSNLPWQPLASTSGTNEQHTASYTFAAEPGVWTVVMRGQIKGPSPGELLADFVSYPVTVTSPAGSVAVELWADDTKGSITIPSGTAAKLTWKSTGATSCISSAVPASAYWPNGAMQSTQNLSPGKTTGALTQSTIFTLTCRNDAGQTGSDSVTVNVSNTPPPPGAGPSVNITVNGLNQYFGKEGDKLTVAWNSYNAVYCETAGGQWGNGSSRPLSGTDPSYTLGAPGFNMFWVIGCRDSAGTYVTARADAYATEDPQTLEVSVDLLANGKLQGVGGSITVPFGSDVELQWLVTNAQQCTAVASPVSSQWRDSKDFRGGRETIPGLLYSTIFQIECTRVYEGQQSRGQSDYVTVNVTSGVRLTALDPAGEYKSEVTIPSGTSTTLQWVTSGNMKKCTASNSANASDFKGSVNKVSGTTPTDKLTSARTYTISCDTDSFFFSKKYTSQAKVNVVSGQTPGVTLTASPNPVASGGTSTLNWTVTNNPTSCTASNDKGNTQWNSSTAISPLSSGNKPITNITQATTFTLTCSNQYGTGTGSVPVTITSSGALTLNVPVLDDACRAIPSGVLSWSYSGTIDAWELEVDDPPGNAIQTGKQTGNSRSFYFPGPFGSLAYGKTYSWGVRIWTGGSPNAGAWVRSTSDNDIETARHRGPQVTFDYSPETPNVNDRIQFNSAITFSDNGPPADINDDPVDDDGRVRSWLFNYPTSSTWTSINASKNNPSGSYTATGQKRVRLTVEDRDDITCYHEETLTIGGGLPLPIFKEIFPR